MKKIIKIMLCALLCAVMVMGVCSCDTTTADDVVVPEGTKNALVVHYTKNSDNTLTVTASVEGDVEYAAISGKMNYDSSVLTYVSHEGVDCSTVNNKEAGVIAFAQANSSNYTEKQTLFKVTFSYTEKTDSKITFTIEEGHFTNASFNDVEYTVIGGDIKLS